MRENTTKIRNIKQYLKAVLFNAPSTIDSYYTALVTVSYTHLATVAFTLSTLSELPLGVTPSVSAVVALPRGENRRNEIGRAHV